MSPFKSVFKKSFIAIACAFGLSVAANAQTAFGSLEADAGEYAPIAIGDNVDVSACSSFFNSSNFGTFNLCDTPTINSISFTWTVTRLFGAFDSITVTGATFSLPSGGAGDFFNVVGEYFLNLEVDALVNPFDLPNGFTGRILGSTTDTDFAQNNIVITNPTSVPEPEALLILLPAMAYMARRQRRRKSAL